MLFDKPIDRRGTYCTQWDYVQDRFGQENLLPFTISDTDFAVPKAVQEALERRVSHGVFGYTRWNHEAFHQAVRSWYQERFDTVLPDDSLVYSPSVIFSLAVMIQLESEVGDGIVMHTPAYDAFYHMIDTSQRKLVESPLRYHDGQYEIDWEHFESCLADEHTRLFLLCSPQNPTGRVWTRIELERMVELCQRYDVFMLSDEIHMDILRQGQKHIPLVQFVQENMAVFTSGSKTFNFPGLIFSYGIIPDQNRRNAFMETIKMQYGLSSTSILGLEATIAAYRQGGEWVDQLNTYLDENISYVKAFLEKNCPAVTVARSQATYLMWLDISNLDISMDLLQKRLVEIGQVAIMDGRVYGGNGAQFLRLNVGCPREKLEDGLHRFLKSINTGK